MKKIIALLNLMIGIVCLGYSQENTNYGNGAPSIGLRNSFFGYHAGKNSNTLSSNNSFFGANCGKNTTNGIGNVAIGSNAFLYNSTGGGNTAIGTFALMDNNASQNTTVGSGALKDNTTGYQNAAFGQNALINNNANQNTAVGAIALHENTTGTKNVGVGFAVMFQNISGTSNTGVGSYSMHDNIIGNHNTAVGWEALYANTSNYNTTIGSQSLYKNMSGTYNTANGAYSLYENTTGYYNSAFGGQSLRSNVSGNFNIAAGYYAMFANTTGIRNSAVGYQSLDKNTTGSQNTASGAFALTDITTGSFNSAFGYDAGPTLADLYNTTAIGYLAVPTASNQVRIGNTTVTSIGGQEEWTAFSDGRFKKDIKEDVSGIDFIRHLRPVSYVVDKIGLNKFLHITDSSSNQAEGTSVPARHTGFIAQEVEDLVKKTGYVFSGVDTPENENDPYGIRYAAFVVPLVKAVQELTATVERQQEQIQLLLSERDSKGEVLGEANRNTNAVLLQNNPNPFTAETEIKMTLPDEVRDASVMIYNLEGKQMKTMQVNDRGEVSVKILRNELSAGMYLYALIIDGKVVDTKRMILTK